jgi:hypothetical protein
MRIFRARVAGGKIEVPSDAFPEGSEVTVVGPETEETFTLTAEQVAELKDSLEQIRRGEYVDGDELLKELRSQARP